MIIWGLEKLVITCSLSIVKRWEVHELWNRNYVQFVARIRDTIENDRKARNDNDLDYTTTRYARHLRGHFEHYPTTLWLWLRWYTLTYLYIYLYTSTVNFFYIVYTKLRCTFILPKSYVKRIWNIFEKIQFSKNLARNEITLHLRWCFRCMCSFFVLTKLYSAERVRNGVNCHTFSNITLFSRYLIRSIIETWNARGTNAHSSDLYPTEEWIKREWGYTNFWVTHGSHVILDFVYENDSVFLSVVLYRRMFRNN